MLNEPSTEIRLWNSSVGDNRRQVWVRRSKGKTLEERTIPGFRWLTFLIESNDIRDASWPYDIPDQVFDILSLSTNLRHQPPHKNVCLWWDSGRVYGEFLNHRALRFLLFSTKQGYLRHTSKVCT